jgi:hypothetical protein
MKTEDYFFNIRFRRCVMFLAPFPQPLGFFPQEHRQAAIALLFIGLGQRAAV